MLTDPFYIKIFHYFETNQLVATIQNISEETFNSRYL